MPIWEEEVKKNRRITKRIRMTESVHFEFKDPAHFGGCRAIDVSETGIRLLISDFIPLHTELLLKVQLAKESVVECMGRVVWIMKLPFGENYQAGLEFVNKETILETKKEIRHFVESQDIVSPL